MDMFTGVLFQQSLQDLVKGIRAHRRDEEQYIRSKITDIGEECRSSDMTKKTNGILKLTHLQMMGFSMSFASFHVVEVMSCADFASKRIGYLAAAQSFSPTTDVLLLTTNQFKKDLTNGKLQDCSQALTCLAKLINEELGRDLEKDISLLLSSPRPYIRKKALLVLYRLILVHPDTLPIVSAKFRERLTDSDQGVVCAAVTVTTELARASPSSFLSLAPILYQLLTNKDSNNWMLIKIVKLMGVLTPLEPRLGKKLAEPLTGLMRTTRAKSLLYECCSTVTSGLIHQPEAVDLCAKRLAEFMDDSDQNLKYLGLLSMRKVIKVHPHLAIDHRDNILDCLDDEDIGIRMRALELVTEFVSKRTLRDLSRILLRKLRTACAEGFIVDDAFTGGISNATESQPGVSSSLDQEAPFREALAQQLLRAGEYKRASGDFKGGYEMLSTADDFAWYMTNILGGLAEIPLLSTGVRDRIADQLLELTSRVEALRSVSVKIAFTLLSAKMGSHEDETAANGGTAGEGPVDEDDPVKEAPESAPRGAKHSEGSLDAILSPSLAGNTAWILGEYAELHDDYSSVMKRLVSFPRKSLDAASQVRILTAVMKVLIRTPEEDALAVFGMATEYVSSLINSQFAEVQERAWFFNSLLSDISVGQRHTMAPLFEGKLIPVDPRAQSKVPLADDIDFDTPLLNTGSESLRVYLQKSLSTADGDFDADMVEDESDLFAEARFSNVPLAMPSTSSATVALLPPQNATAKSLPESTNKTSNPFYLNGESSGSSHTTRRQDGDDANGRYGMSRFELDTAQGSSEAAVVIAEENPLGLNLSDDDRSGGQGIHVDKRLEAAFQGAFEPIPGSSTTKPKKGKRKKRKATREEPKKMAMNQETSLIDFGDSLMPEAPVAKESVRPKHLADALLM